MKKAWDNKKIDHLFKQLPKQTMSDGNKQKISNHLESLYENSSAKKLSFRVWITRSTLTAFTIMALFFFLFTTEGKDLTNQLFTKYITTNENIGQQEDPTLATNDDELLFIEEKDGLEYKVILNNTTFNEGEEIEVDVTVTNVSNSDISYVSGSSSCPTTGINITIEHKSGKRLLKVAKHAEDRVCTDDVNFSILKPGETRTLQETFITQYENGNSSNIQAGEYMVNVGFFTKVNTIFTFPITITTSTTEVGVNELEAIVLAKDQKEIIEWMNIEDRTLLAVITEDGTTYYSLNTQKNEWNKVEGELKVNPEHLVNAFATYFAEDAYWIITFNQATSPYLEMKVKIDAYTSEILEIWEASEESLTTEADEQGFLYLEDILKSFETHGIGPLQHWVNDGSEEESIIAKKYSNTKSVTYYIQDEIVFHLYVCESIEERKKVYEEFKGEFKMKSFIHGTMIIDNVLIFFQGYQKRGLYEREWPVRLKQVDRDLSNR
ncbi:hypothetical protein CIB95_01490 [Lottiidibacillus patelloidae]|uniref:Uncharacterized protein n=1 Tax=Lottiidibacillus patelloidae TaxID=2670334 RepID=A0A263BXH5_9BACI|nr:hypothetical protein [Lottiidibacillus patelloidae]OZM58272.1 hypothetical protein CIB95_01490 [Lottiidibacillus patelloidae]